MMSSIEHVASPSSNPELMIFDDAAFSRELVALMSCAFDAAREQILAREAVVSEASEKLMALGIMLAVQAGEREVQALKDIAVDAASRAPQTSQI